MDPDKRRKGSIRQKEKEWWHNINSENLLKNIWDVSINSIIVALINLLFHFILTRKLGPSQYGELETLLTINNMLLIAMSAVSFIVARFVSQYRTRQQYDKMRFLANWAFIFFFMIGIAGLIVTIMTSRLAAAFLNIEDYTVIMIFGLLVWISFLMPIIEGILRGLQEFRFVGRYKMLDAALKLLLGGGLVMLGLGVKPVIGALALASIATILSTGYILKRMYINKPYSIALKEIYTFAIPVFLACITFAILSNIDLVLVKHFFDARSTGYFAAAAILAKITLGMAFGSAAVMFPKVVEKYSNGDTKALIKTFKNTLKIAVFGGLLITLALAIYPGEIAHAFFGKQYVIGEMLGVYAIATFFLGLSAIMMMFDLAVKRYAFIGMFSVAAFFEIYQIAIHHHDLYAIVWTLFVINLIVLAFMLWYNKKEVFANYEDYW